MEKITGLINAPFTPIKSNGYINLEIIPEYAAMLAKNGHRGIFINGSLCSTRDQAGYLSRISSKKKLNS